MAMEYMEHDLRAYLDHLREPLSLAEIKCIVQQLLSALAYMHDHWVVHRDLKTPNVLINNDGRVCLCDFGLARSVDSPR
jgi:cell division cycle 2-like